MFLKWLKGRNKTENTNVESESTKAVGMGTIDLNPFGNNYEQSRGNDAETALMSSVEDDGVTEIWQTVGSTETQETEHHRAPMAAEDDAVGLVGPTSVAPKETTYASFVDVGIVIPSLRLQAIELRQRLELMGHDGEPGEVAKLWKAYLRLVPSDANGWLSLGELHLSQGQLETAEVVFKAALKFKPDDAMTNGALGHTLVAQGKFTQAHDFLATACQLMPHELELQMAYLECLKACGNEDDIARQAIIIDDLRRGSR